MMQPSESGPRRSSLLFGEAPSFADINSYSYNRQVQKYFQDQVVYGNFWYLFRKYLPFAAPIVLIITFLIPCYFYNSVDGYLFCGSVLSLLTCLLALLSYVHIKPWRRHPSSLIIQICGMSVCISLIIIIYTFPPVIFSSGHDRETHINLTDDADISPTAPACLVTSFFSQLTLLAREMWILTLSLDLWTSITNPFASYKSNIQKYHTGIWIFTIASSIILVNENHCQGAFLTNGICWIQIDNIQNLCLWGYFLAWILLIYVNSIVMIAYAYARIRKGLESTYETRFACVSETFRIILFYVCYGVALLGFLFLLTYLPVIHDEYKVFFQNIFIFCIACRGYFDGLVWFFSHGFLDPNPRQQYRYFTPYHRTLTWRDIFCCGCINWSGVRWYCWQVCCGFCLPQGDGNELHSSKANSSDEASHDSTALKRTVTNTSAFAGESGGGQGMIPGEETENLLLHHPEQEGNDLAADLLAHDALGSHQDSRDSGSLPSGHSSQTSNTMHRHTTGTAAGRLTSQTNVRSTTTTLRSRNTANSLNPVIPNRISDIDLSPQLNLALRREVVSLVTYGIEQSVYRSMERERKRNQYYNDPYAAAIGEGYQERSVYGSGDNRSDGSWQNEDGFVRIRLSSGGSDLFPNLPTNNTVKGPTSAATATAANTAPGVPRKHSTREEEYPPSSQPQQSQHPAHGSNAMLSGHHQSSVHQSFYTQQHHNSTTGTQSYAFPPPPPSPHTVPAGMPSHHFSGASMTANSSVFSSVVHHLLNAVGTYIPGEYGVDPILNANNSMNFRPFTDRQSDSSSMSTTSSNNSNTYHSPMIYKTTYPFMDSKAPIAYHPNPMRPATAYLPPSINPTKIANGLERKLTEDINVSVTNIGADDVEFGQEGGGHYDTPTKSELGSPMKLGPPSASRRGNDYIDRLVAWTSPIPPAAPSVSDNMVSPASSSLFAHTPGPAGPNHPTQHQHQQPPPPSPQNSYSRYFSIRRTIFGEGAPTNPSNTPHGLPPPPPPPPAEVVFKLYDKHVFRDFRPITFQKLRELANISCEKYIELIQQPTQERLSEGKSGAFFFICGQGEVIVKSIEAHEAQTLLSILDDYYAHIQSHPHSFLVRFLGLHSIVMYGTEFHFVTMKNIFPAGISLYEKYDIKGSFIQRHAKRCTPGKLSTCKHCGQEFIEGYDHYGQSTGGSSGITGLSSTGNSGTNGGPNAVNALRSSIVSRNTLGNESTLPTSSYSGYNPASARRRNECPVKLGPHESSITLKDNDLMNKLALYPEDVYEIIHTLYSDSDFLCALGLMDYSCLLGVQYQEYDLEAYKQQSTKVANLPWNGGGMVNMVNTGNSGPNATANTGNHRLGQPSQAHMLNETSTATATATTAITSTTTGSSNSTAMITTTATTIPTASTAVIPVTSTGAMPAVPNGTDPFIHNHECKSFPVRSVSAPKEYYLGMIDVLQTWSWQKQVEYLWKVHVLGYPADGISCIPPKEYKLRYQYKIAQMFDHEKFVREVTGSWQGKREVGAPFSLMAANQPQMPLHTFNQ